MAENNWELDYTFKKIIEKSVYHFEIVLRNFDNFDEHIIGWAIVNAKTSNVVFKVSKSLKSFITNNDFESFIKKMIEATTELDRTIYNYTGGYVHD